MNLLVLIGSLRSDSFNLRLARAAVADLGDEVTVRFHTGLADLPHYNEELDVDPVPHSAAVLRSDVEWADALLLITPEYNGMLSGAAKNAIDWASRPRGAASLSGKPAAVMSATASPRGGQWARESAMRALSVGGADVLSDSVGVGSAFQAFDGDRLLDDQAAAAARQLVDALLRLPAAA